MEVQRDEMKLSNYLSLQPSMSAPNPVDEEYVINALLPVCDWSEKRITSKIYKRNKITDGGHMKVN